MIHIMIVKANMGKHNKHSNDWSEIEQRLSKPRKRRPRVKVSGKSVLKLREIISRRAKRNHKLT